MFTLTIFTAVDGRLHLDTAVPRRSLRLPRAFTAVDGRLHNE
jgi:hypothetical protein